MKIACIRLDKIGDLIVTLPSDQVFIDHEVTWLIPKGLEPLCELAEPKRSFISIPLRSSVNGFIALYKGLSNLKPDATVIYFAPWWAGLACYLAGVGIRVGRLSQWWSYVFLNQGLRQKRSLSEKHELEYNLELSQRLLGAQSFAEDRPRKNSTLPNLTLGLTLSPPPLRQLLEKYSLRTLQYIVVHPGMKGSAWNWSLDQYSKLISELAKTHQVVITGTLTDSEWVAPLMSQFQGHSHILFLYNRLNLKELLYILKFARCVVVPSTGVAHLAASVGSRTIGLYPDNTKQSPNRWRPLGAQVTLVTSKQPELAEITVAQVVDLCLT